MVAATAALIMQADSTAIGNPDRVRSLLMQSCTDVTHGFSANDESAGPYNDLATGTGRAGGQCS